MKRGLRAACKAARRWRRRAPPRTRARKPGRLRVHPPRESVRQRGRVQRAGARAGDGFEVEPSILEEGVEHSPRVGAERAPPWRARLTVRVSSSLPTRQWYVVPCRRTRNPSRAWADRGPSSLASRVASGDDFDGQRSGITRQDEARPEEGMWIGASGGKLRVAKSRRTGLSVQESAIEVQHQLGRGFVVDAPQTHQLALGASYRECPAQTLDSLPVLHLADPSSTLSRFVWRQDSQRGRRRARASARSGRRAWP